MTLQPKKQTILVHELPNILIKKRQFGHLLGYNKRKSFLEKS